MNVLAAFRRLLGLGAPAYASTDPRRQVFREGWDPQPLTANDALAPSLAQLVAQGRDLDRRVPKAAAVIDGFRADVIGCGCSIEPTTGDRARDARLRDAFHAWAEEAGVAGETLWELQWLAAGEVVAAGAALWRWVVVPDAVGIPLRLLPLEVEWLAEEPLAEVPAERFCRGKETDALGRVVRYHLVDPVTGAGEIVPAADIVHGYLPRRARQLHGEPKLAVLVERLWQDDRLVVTELRASINGAAPAGIITSPDADMLGAGGGNTVAGSAGSPGPAANPGGAVAGGRLALSPGGILALAPGETWTTVENKRPAQGIAPFRAAMDGDLAAGAGVSRQWLDRDSGRANYSSMREDNLRTERRLGPERQILGRHWAAGIYRRLLPYLLLQLGERWPADPRARAALARCELRPDRPEYVDPMKDAEALVYQVDHNLLTLEEALAARNRDLETVLQKRAAEKARLRELGLDAVPAPAPTQTPDPVTP